MDVLFGFKFRRTFLDVCRQALVSVLTLKQMLLELALERQTLGKRHLQARTDRALDPPHGACGLLRRQELLRVGRDFLEEIVAVEHLVDQADLLGFLEGKRSPSGHELEGARRSEERRVGKECRSRWSAYH